MDRGKCFFILGCFMNRLIVCFVFYFTIIFNNNSVAQNYLRYSNYTQSNGLTDNYINCINQDHRGFIWIGAWSGLNRFDGFNFKQYTSNKKMPDGMMGNWIFKIFEDRNHDLWVCTNAELLKYNWDKDQFIKIKGIDSVAVFDIVQDSKGYLWVSTEFGLLKYDSKQNKIIKRFSNSGKSPNFPTSKLTDIVIDKNDNLWIGSLTCGLVYFNTTTLKYQVYEIKTQDKNNPLFYNVRSLVFDKEGCLWMIGKYNNGIAIFDTTLKSFSIKKHDPNNIHSIPNNAVSRISCDKQGVIWVCCQNECLSRYDKKTNDFYRYSRDPFITTSLNAQSVSCLFTDNGGNSWVGSHGNGIFLLNKQKNKFKSFSMLSSKGLTLPGNIISSFTEMSDGKIIVAVDGGGFCEFDRNTERFKTYNSTNGIISNAITKVLSVKNNMVWITSWNGGLTKFNYKTKEINNYVSNPNDKFSLIHNNVKDVYQIGDDSLWIVTHGQGLSLMNTKNNTFISHISGVKTPFDFSLPVWGNSIIKDHKGRLWISTVSSLCMFDGKKYISFNKAKNKERKNSSDLVFMTYEDYKGVIWIVTDKAIDFYNEKTNNCETFDKIPGMPHNPKAIIEDLHNNLWISSNDGLSCIDADRKHIKQYSIIDGLPSNDFVFRSVYRLKDGTLLFGGTFGFIMFHPDSLLENQKKPFVVLNDLYLNHTLQIPGEKNSLLKKALQSTDTLKYLYNQDVISFNIAGVEISNPDKITYSYKIKGLNVTWINLGNERVLTIPNLEPGTYTLFVKASKSDKVFSINGNGLTIIVMPPWWKTIWFKLLLFLFISGSIAYLVFLRLKSMEKDKIILEKLVESKTKSLHSTMESLHEAKLVIEMKNAELLESIDMKDKLIGIIGHDFKSPLTATVGLLNLIKVQTNSISKEKLSQYIDVLYESTEKLSNKLLMMTHWAQSRHQSIIYNPVEINIESLINDAIILVKENARQKNISISVQADYTHNSYVDARMIHTVFLNLLSNAVKFTQENGSIVVVINEDSSMLEISFIDSGIGIEAERIHLILTDSEKTQSTIGTKGEYGFGFGLQICKQFIEKNKGTFSIKSNVGKGSVFLVGLPVGKTQKETIESKEESNTVAIKSHENELESENKKYSILIIDDDEELMFMLQQTFESNFKVIKAFDGKTGLHLAQNMIPDIIVSDINLPEISGLEVCNLLKKDGMTCHIPVILISGEKIPGLQSECYSYGANDFLEKPFNSTFLKQKIMALLENIDLNKQKNFQTDISQSLFVLPESADDIILKKIVDLLINNIENANCDIDSIAVELGLSRTQLWRKTKTMLGKTPSEIIRDLRLQKASEMIISGKYRVSDIAYHVGFNDPRYFSRSFTKAFGMSPTEYFEKSQKTMQ